MLKAASSARTSGASDDPDVPTPSCRWAPLGHTNRGSARFWPRQRRPHRAAVRGVCRWRDCRPHPDRSCRRVLTSPQSCRGEDGPRASRPRTPTGPMCWLSTSRPARLWPSKSRRPAWHDSASRTKTKMPPRGLASGSSSSASATRGSHRASSSFLGAW
jgi:hypothetical protein